MSYLRVKSTSKVKLKVVDGVLRVNEYEVLTTIGRGAYGEVNLARNIATGDFVAMKGYSKRALSKMREFYRINGESIVVDGVDKALAEVDALCVLAGHPNITNLLEVLEDDNLDDMHLVFEYLDGGPLMTYDGDRECFTSKATGGPLDERTAKHVFLDVVTGLAYVHTNKIAHRDIKPDNLLTTSTGITKIADFGVSKRFKDGEPMMLSDNQGAPLFQAPEACVGEPYDPFKADIWALGICLYAMATGKLPFGAPSMSPMGVYEAIEKKPLPKLPDSCSPELQDLVGRLLEKNPEKRISLADARLHPWVRSAPVLLPIRPASPREALKASTGALSKTLSSARGHSWLESSVSFERSSARSSVDRPLAVVDSASSAWDPTDATGTPRLPTSLNMYMGGVPVHKETVFTFPSDSEDSDDPDLLRSAGIPVTPTLELRASQREAKKRVQEWTEARKSGSRGGGGGSGGGGSARAAPAKTAGVAAPSGFTEVSELTRRTSFPSMDIGSCSLYTSPIMLCLESEDSRASFTGVEPPTAPVLRPPPGTKSTSTTRPPPPLPKASVSRAPGPRASTDGTTPKPATPAMLHRAPSLNLPPGGLRGWLRKQGRLLKRYSKKYFVLRDHILAYYNSEPSPATPPTGEYNLFTPGFHTRVQSEPKPGFVFRFVIFLPHRRVTLLANTAEEYLQWLTALVEVVEYDWEARVRRLSRVM